MINLNIKEIELYEECEIKDGQIDFDFIYNNENSILEKKNTGINNNNFNPL